MTSKYDPLKKDLLDSPRGPIKMSFFEIERILGFSLPKSARTYNAWWLDRSAGTTHSQARAWLNAGRLIQNVYRNAAVVTFTPIGSGV